MDELKEGPDFLGVKLKYWAPLMTQYQQAKRDGQLTDDSQAIPLIVRSGTALDLKYSVKIEEIDDSGNVTKDVGTVTRSLDKDYLPFVSKSPFALAWPGSKDLTQLLGDTGSFSQGLYNPATWSTDFAAAPKYKDGETAANGAVDKSATPGDWVTVNRLPDKSANGEARRPDPAQARRRALLPPEPRNRQEARHAAGHGLRHVRRRERQGGGRRRQPPAPGRL